MNFSVVKLPNLTFTVNVLEEQERHQIFEIFLSNEKIAHLNVFITDKCIYSFDAYVKKEFQRKGIASFLYQYAETYHNKTIKPYEYFNSEAHTSSDAIEFWRTRGFNLNDRYRLFD